MSIKCASCKNSHETVAEVRECHFSPKATSPASPAMIPGLNVTVAEAETLKGGLLGQPVDGQGWPVRSARTATSPTTPDLAEAVYGLDAKWAQVIRDINWEISEYRYHHNIGRGATEKQVDFTESLLARRVHGLESFLAEQTPNSNAWLRSLPMKAISLLISELKSAPVKSGKEFVPNVVREDAPEAPKVPAGRYAITGADGETKFYKVDRPTEGRWAGYTFVKIQAGSDYHRVPAQRAILVKIAEDGPEAAMLRYGRELGHCGHCGRELTNDESRKIGIGPVCRSKVSF